MYKRIFEREVKVEESKEKVEEDTNSIMLQKSIDSSIRELWMEYDGAVSEVADKLAIRLALNIKLIVAKNRTKINEDQFLKSFRAEFS